MIDIEFKAASLVGERWGMAEVSSEPRSKLVLEGPLTEKWADTSYRAASYRLDDGTLLDEAFGNYPEVALLNLLLRRNVG